MATYRTGRRRVRFDARRSLRVPIVALIAVVASCSDDHSDAPPTDADLDTAVHAVERAADEHDIRLALACDLDDVVEMSWTFDEAAVVSPTVVDAVAHALQDQFWSSFDLPSGRRDALVENAIEDGPSANVPVLVDRSLRVLLGIEARDGGYTPSGAMTCI